MMDTIISLIILTPMAWLCYASSVAITQRKRLWKEGETDYYGNPIDEENK
jgi:hypothetical protein